MNISSRTAMRILAVSLAVTAAGASATGIRTTDARTTDARGVEFALPQPATRIVTLAPSLAEIAFAAGAGAHVVGVSSYSDYPEAARRLPVVADYGRVNIERLLALQPDLVLAWGSGTPARDVARIERLGIPVLVVEPRTLADIAGALRVVGRLAGTSSVAEQAARAFEKDVAALRSAAVGRDTDARAPSVFFEIWHAPLITVDGKHLISEILRLCGGRNVFADAPVLVPRIALEALLARDPAIIFTTAAPDRPAALRLWRDTPMLRAVRTGHVYTLDPNLINRQGPRVIEGARDMCSALATARTQG